MMNKRLLCFILTICIFGSAIIGTGTAAAASPSAENEAYTAAAELLETLGIFGESSGELADTYVKRGDFVGYAADALKVDDSQGVVGYYKDVKAETKNAAAIEALFKMGALSAAEDGRFNPDRNITMDEAIKVLLAAAGYQEKALLSGGLYTGYYWLAKDLDLLNNLSYEGSRAISKGEAAVMLKNFLRMNMYEVVGMSVDSEGNVNLGRATGETVLKKYFNIDYFEGVINSNRFTSLMSPENVGEGMVQVGEMLLNAGATDISMWLGYSAEVYYDIDREEVVHYDLSDSNAILEIEDYDEPKWENNAISYYNSNDVRVSKQIPADATIIYNNRAVDVFKSEYIDIDNGVITLIDADGRNGYETVMIKDYQAVVVEAFNEDSEVISTKYNGGTINLENKEYEIYDENGKRLANSYVREWDVLNILNPDGDGVIVIYRTRNQISGRIASISDEDILLDNGERYEMLDGFYEANGATLKPGTRGVLYLDIMGYAAAFMVQNEESGLGYIIGYVEQGIFDKAVSVKMALHNPSDPLEMVYVFDISDNAKIDGEKIEGEKLVGYFDEIINSGNELIVTYRLNGDGEILELDTIVLGASEDPDSTLVLDRKVEQSEASGLLYQPSSRLFSGKIAMASDAIAFYVPDAENSSDSDYGAVRANMGNRSGWAAFNTYKIGADKITADAITFNQAYGRAAGSFGTYDRMAFITGIWETYDEETDEIRYSVGFWRNGGYAELMVMNNETLDKTYTDSTDPENVITTVRRLQPGDLAMISINSDGDIDDYKLLYNSETKQVGEPATPGANYNYENYHSTHRVYLGYVYELQDGIVALSDRNPAELVEAAKAVLAPTYGDNIPASVLKTEVLKSCVKFNMPSDIRILDTEKGFDWKACGTDDILTYLMYGDECSKMLVMTTYSYAQSAAIVD